jgi:hypothetical protein
MAYSFRIPRGSSVGEHRVDLRGSMGTRITVVFTVTGAARVAAQSKSAAATPAPEVAFEPFADGFESGFLGQWTTVDGLVAQQSDAFGGGWSARAASAGGAVFAYRSLTPAQSDLYVRVRFKFISLAEGAGITLFDLQTESGSSIGSLIVTPEGKLAFRNGLSGETWTSDTAVLPGEWHEAQLHLRIDGSLVEAWYDGKPLKALSGPAHLGSVAIGRLQLGDNTADKTYDIVFDDILADTVAIPYTGPVPAMPTETPEANATATPTVTNEPSPVPTETPAIEPTEAPVPTYTPVPAPTEVTAEASPDGG